MTITIWAEVKVENGYVYDDYGTNNHEWCQSKGKSCIDNISIVKTDHRQTPTSSQLSRTSDLQRSFLGEHSRQNMSRYTRSQEQEIQLWRVEM